MMDVARQEGFEVEPDVLAAAIGVPVIPMTAAKGEGVHAFIDAALQVAREGPAREPNRPEIRADHRAVLAQLLELVSPLRAGALSAPIGWRSSCWRVMPRLPR